MLPPRAWSLDAERGELVCECGVGHSKNEVHGCCPNSCCSGPDFPWRNPSPGDLAVCGAGYLGVVTKAEKNLVTYSEGGQDLAFVGVHINKDVSSVLPHWSSRLPVVLPFSVSSIMSSKRPIRSFQMMFLRAKPYLPKGWPSRMIFLDAAQGQKILDWFKQHPITENAT